MNPESFNEEFCLTLEYHLGPELFAAMNDEMVKGFWCDGVLMPSDSELIRKKINDTRKIETTAFAGTDGQNKFKLIIRFGKYSLRRYAKGTSLNDCLPDADDIKIDPKKELIELYLK